MLRHLADPGIELQLEAGLAAQLLIENARELGLLGLHPVGVAGDVGDGGEIERREHAMMLVAILERRRHQTLRNEGLRGAERLEHIEGRRMEGRSAGLHAEVRAGLEYGHGHAAAHEVGSGDEADRPRAGDQDAIFNGHVIRPRVARAVVVDCTSGYWIGSIPALWMMSRHLAISEEISLVSSSGVAVSASAPCSVKRACTVGSSSAAVNSLLSLSIIGFGVPFGASIMNQPELS